MRVIRAEQLTRSATGANRGMEEHCVYSAICRIAGVTVELRTDVAEVARLYGLRYADHASALEPDFRYFVATVRGGYAFWCSHAATWRWTHGALPADAVAFLADSVVLNAVVRFDTSLASMHASAVEFNGFAAAIAGNSAANRAATLLACVRRNMRVYSDERVLLRGNVVYPFLRRCSVRAAGTRLLLADREPPQDDFVRSTPALSLKTCLGADAMASPRPLRALFAIAGTGHCAALELVDTSVALGTIIRWYDTRGDMIDRATKAIGLLQNVRCYRLTLGSPDETSAAIAYALNRMGRR